MQQDVESDREVILVGVRYDELINSHETGWEIEVDGILSTSVVQRSECSCCFEESIHVAPMFHVKEDTLYCASKRCGWCHYMDADEERRFWRGVGEMQQVALREYGVKWDPTITF